jgi:hypothetical protein
MYCSPCGTQVGGEALFCHMCGAEVAMLPDEPTVRSENLAARANRPFASSDTAERSLPRWLLACLSRDERVLADVSVGEQDYYATDKRLLVFRGKSSPDAVDYRRMSVQFHRYGWPFTAWRLFVGACALVTLGLALLFTQHVKMDEATIGPRWDVAAVCAALAVLLLAMAIVGRYGYYSVTVREPTPEGAGNWHYRLERLRFAPRNEALDHLMHVLEQKAVAAFGPNSGMEAGGSRRGEGSAPVLPATLAGILTGAALMTFYVLTAHATPKLSTEGQTTFVHVDLLIIPISIGCASAAGLVGGLLSNWRGATVGGTAGVVVAVGVIAWLLFATMAQAPPAIQETPTGFTFNQLQPSFILDAIGPWALASVAAIGLGALAGRLGEHMRAGG